MKEADFQRIFTKWVREHHDGINAVWELKLEKGSSFAFGKVADHQIDGLRTAKHKGIFHKISDAPFGHSGFRFHRPKPFDCLFVKCDAFIVICFYKPRRVKEMHWIDVDRFVKERDASDRKSLTEERAREIAQFSTIV